MIAFELDAVAALTTSSNKTYSCSLERSRPAIDSRFRKFEERKERVSLVYHDQMTFSRVIRTPVDNLLGHIYDRGMYIGSMYINGF